MAFSNSALKVRLAVSACDEPRATVLDEAPRQILGEIEETIRDPELLDVLRQHKLVLDDLLVSRSIEEREHDTFAICELSRDAAIRLTPFTADRAPLVELACRLCEQSVQAIDRLSPSADMKKHAENVRRRVRDYLKFLSTLAQEPVLVPAN